MPPECATPGCTHTGGHGFYLRLWCRRCADELARIRAEWEAAEPTAAQIVDRAVTPRAA